MYVVANAGKAKKLFAAPIWHASCDISMCGSKTPKREKCHPESQSDLILAMNSNYCQGKYSHNRSQLGETRRVFVDCGAVGS
jgi:hypothetical protein